MVTDGELSFVIFLYAAGEIQWTSGDASGGIDGLGGYPPQIGFNAGDGVRYAGPRNFIALNIDETEGNTGDKGVWIFRVDEATFNTPGECSYDGKLNEITTYRIILLYDYLPRPVVWFQMTSLLV